MSPSRDKIKKKSVEIVFTAGRLIGNERHFDCCQFGLSRILQCYTGGVAVGLNIVRVVMQLSANLFPFVLLRKLRHQHLSHCRYGVDGASAFVAASSSSLPSAA